MVGVEQNNEIVVLDRMAAPVAFGHATSVQKDTQAAREGLVPFLVGHLLAAGREPDHVLHFGIAHRAAAEEDAPPEQGMGVAQRDDALRERTQPLAFRRYIP